MNWKQSSKLVAEALGQPALMADHLWVRHLDSGVQTVSILLPMEEEEENEPTDTEPEPQQRL